MKTATEDRQEISPELWRVWEDKTRLRDKAHARKITASASAVLLLLWVTGMTTRYTLGGSIHVLLVVAVAALVVHAFWEHRSIL